MLSVAAVQARLTWVALTAVAPRPLGFEGGVVSGPVGPTGVFMSVWISVAESARL